MYTWQTIIHAYLLCKNGDNNTYSNLKQAKQESFEKSKKIVSLESEVDSLQKRASGDLEKKIQSLEAKAEELSKVEQLEGNLKKSRENAQKLQDKLELSEAKVHELTTKLAQAEKSSTHLRKKTRDAEEARKIAENLLLKAKSEAAAKAQELYKVYEAWLPPWVAGRLAQIQSTSAVYWTLYGEPVFKKAAEHASRHATTAKEWAQPHVDTLKKALLRVRTGSTNGKVLASKVSEAYNVHLSPHFVKANEQLMPRIKSLRKQLRPHVDKAAAYVRPYYEKSQEYAAPHIEKVQQVSKEALSSAVNYHNKMQNSVRGLLLKHEVASKELVWFLAMAILVLPAAVAMHLVLSTFSGSKKVKKPSRSHANAHKKSKKSKHLHRWRQAQRSTQRSSREKKIKWPCQD
ncbi:hypothetical protein SELMODRAFT_405791 [Selaginella moellendorffii]|uniref:Uncharacterized protein n=1 Tax=Selaginella moellendorffii TaxID=88036 RepID=D8QZQ3_SELML|nr:hypothetical protein SELMODRAFT_405791 [Selaginella moellendorffii]